MKIQFFRKSRVLTNEYLSKIFRADEALMKYVPDGVLFKYLPRTYLLSVIYHVKNDIYQDLVNERNKELEKRNMNNYEKYSLFITEEFKGALVKLPELKGIILLIC